MKNFILFKVSSRPQRASRPPHKESNEESGETTTGPIARKGWENKPRETHAPHTSAEDSDEQTTAAVQGRRGGRPEKRKTEPPKQSGESNESGEHTTQPSTTQPDPITRFN